MPVFLQRLFLAEHGDKHGLLPEWNHRGHYRFPGGYVPCQQAGHVNQGAVQAAGCFKTLLARQKGV